MLSVKVDTGKNKGNKTVNSDNIALKTRISTLASLLYNLRSQLWNKKVDVGIKHKDKAKIIPAITSALYQEFIRRKYPKDAVARLEIFSIKYSFDKDGKINLDIDAQMRFWDNERVEKL